VTPEPPDDGKTTAAAAAALLDNGGGGAASAAARPRGGGAPPPPPTLPPLDSLNVWPLISGANATSPRVEWPLTPLGELGDGTAAALARAPHGGDAAYMAEGR